MKKSIPVGAKRLQTSPDLGSEQTLPLGTSVLVYGHPKVRTGAYETITYLSTSPFTKLWEIGHITFYERHTGSTTYRHLRHGYVQEIAQSQGRPQKYVTISAHV